MNGHYIHLLSPNFRKPQWPYLILDLYDVIINKTNRSIYQSKKKAKERALPVILVPVFRLSFACMFAC